MNNDLFMGMISYPFILSQVLENCLL